MTTEHSKISQGFSGDAVTLLQQGLASAGFLTGPADGKFGPKTTEALRAFQAAHGLAVDGIAGPATWERLVAEALVPPAPGPDQLVVRFAPGVLVDLLAGATALPGLDAGAVARALELPAELLGRLEELAAAHGGEGPRIGDIAYVPIPPGADAADLARRLLELPQVEAAAPAHGVRLTRSFNDPLLGSGDQVVAGQSPPNQWYLFRCRADRAWDMSTGSGATIGVVDGGFVLDHEDLVANIDLANAYDVASRSSTIPAPMVTDHATNVMGFAAADANNGKGIAGFAPDARIVPVQFSSAGRAAGTALALGILHFIFVSGAGQRVLNLSVANWATQTGDVILESDPLIAEMIRLAGLANIVVVISAGNTARDASRDGAGNLIPDSGSIVVTATAYDPATNPPLPGTGWGARVDLCAPGDERTDTTCAHPVAGVGGRPYGTMGMTSAAVPKVAGTAALMRSVNPALTPPEVRDILRRTGRAPAAIAGQPIGAFLDAGAAVQEALHRHLVATSSQAGWRWCRRCQGLHLGGHGTSRCPAGGAHDATGSGDYVLPQGVTVAFGQSGWRSCAKCAGLFFGSASGLACAAGGTHDATGSGDYALDHDGSPAFAQAGWRWCRACSALFFTGHGNGTCPAGGAHDSSQSGAYVLKQA